jgi:hypothetical protein
MMPSGKEGPSAIAFARRPVIGPTYDERLIIKLILVGNSRNDRALAREEAKHLLSDLHANDVSLVRFVTAAHQGSCSGVCPPPLPRRYGSSWLTGVMPTS